MSLDIENTFKGYISKKGTAYSFKHNQATFFKILPYTTRIESKSIEKLDFKSFDGVIGRCYRTMIEKDLPKNVREEESYNVTLKSSITSTVIKKVKMDEELKDRFMTIVNSMFFNGDELVKFSPLSQAYLFWKKRDPGLENIADFIYEVFVSDDIVSDWTTQAGFSENIFQQLINSSLPPLEPVRSKKKKKTAVTELYRIQNPEIRSLFEKDFRYLYAKDKQSFLKESDQLFKFYYFLYVTQLGISLNNFFSDNGEMKPLYFTLESETVSENRRTVKQGWKMIEPKLMNLMSHSVALDILNRLELNGEYGYNYCELKSVIEGFSAERRQDLLNLIDELIAFYIIAVKPEKKMWDEFGPELERIQKSLLYTDVEKKIVEFFQRIEFQFEYSSRKSKRKSFSNWFIFFCKENFLKNRGRNGFTLNLSHEMLIFLTRICIGDRSKIRLNDLMNSFQERGIYFDETTKKAVIDVYEKINVIEKKSDSGDAQYIRQIL